MTITFAHYNIDGSVTAGPMEGQVWHGLTPDSRFWPQVQDWMSAGNVIQPYRPSTVDVLNQPLDRLTFWLVAARAGISKWTVRSHIEAMPDGPEKFEAIAWFEEARQYRRDDPLLVSLAEAAGISYEQLDALWTQAAGG